MRPGRVKREGELLGALTRRTTGLELLVGRPPEGGDGALCGDGHELCELTVRLGASAPLDERHEGLLADTASVGEKREARFRGLPQPTHQRAKALRLRLDR